jgi:hypothetical protein
MEEGEFRATNALEATPVHFPDNATARFKRLERRPIVWIFRCLVSFWER